MKVLIAAAIFCILAQCSMPEHPAGESRLIWRLSTQMRDLDFRIEMLERQMDSTARFGRQNAWVGGEI